MADERKVFGKGTCNKCDLPLAFYRLPNGKACPCNPDGTDHWDTCRTVRYKRMKEAAGGELTRIKEKGGAYTEGYVNKDTGEIFKTAMSSGVVTPRQHRQRGKD